MKSRISPLPLAVAAVMSAAVPATAAPVEIFFSQHDYGTDPGRQAPAGGVDPVFNNLKPEWVEEADYLSVRFQDMFDFTGLRFHSISSMTLTLTHSINEITSPFSLMVAGSDGLSMADDFTSSLTRDGDLISPWVTQSFVMDATTDAGGVDAFATAIRDQELSFSFRDDTPILTPSSMLLSSASLSIEGIAVVPLPAPILLLLAALGGLGLYGRRAGRNAAAT